MSLSEQEMAALSERVAALVMEKLAAPIANNLRTIELAKLNGDRITKLEKVVAQFTGPEFYMNTAEQLLNSLQFPKLVGRGFQEMISHATATFRKDLQGWLGKPFLDNGEAAKLMGIHPKQLSAMRKRGEGPRWSGHGKMIRYERMEVETWLREMPTADDA